LNKELKKNGIGIFKDSGARYKFKEGRRYKKGHNANLRKIAVEINRRLKDKGADIEFETVFLVINELPEALTKLLFKFGEIMIHGFGSIISKKVEVRNASREYQSSDENGKKLGYQRAFIDMDFIANSALKLKVNNRPTFNQKREILKKRSAEERANVRREVYEEEAALNLFYLFDGILSVEDHVEKYSDLVHWDDISCYYTKTGKKSEDLPVRDEEVLRRLKDMIRDVNNDDFRYYSTWDAHSVKALRGRNIEPDLALWKGHDFSEEGYFTWWNQQTKKKL